MANTRVGIDTFPVAGEGRAGVVVGGSGGCGSGAEDGEGERDGEQDGADAGHGVPLVGCRAELSVECALTVGRMFVVGRAASGTAARRTPKELEACMFVRGYN